MDEEAERTGRGGQSFGVGWSNAKSAIEEQM